MKRKSKRKGGQEEEFLLEVLKRSIPELRLTANSGAVHGNGDLGTKDWLIEIKSTAANSFRITQDLVKQTKRRASSMGKEAVLVILTNSTKKDEDSGFIVFPLDVGLGILKEANGKNEEES